MELNFIEKLQDAIKATIEKQNISSKNLEQEEIELAQKLNAIEEFVIDRFEEEIAILENRQTKERIEVPKNQLPDNTKEGTILKRINGKYIQDQEQTKNVEEDIKKRMDNLWN